jgi:hypothetical protein
MYGTFDDLDEPNDGDLEMEASVFDLFLPPAVTNLAKGVMGMINPTPPRQPLPGVTLPTTGSGVLQGQLNTPAGSATIALPSAVVKQEEFRAIVDRLETSLNQITSRINSVNGDVGTLRNNFTKVETDTRTQLTNLSTYTRKALAKAKKDQSSQQMTNLMMTLMMQQQSQSQFNEHTHVLDADLPEVATEKPTGTTTGNNNMMFMILPMLMTGDSNSSDNMMLPMMMMMMSNQNK